MSRAVVALALLLSCACASDPRAWMTYQAAGEAAARSARYEKAETLLRQALAETHHDAERARSLRALARVARERGDLGAARARLDEARGPAGSGTPEAVELALEEGWLLLAEGRPADALAVFDGAKREGARALGEEHAALGWAAAGRGEALRRLGDRAGARAALEEALERHRSVQTVEALRPAETLGLLTEMISLGALEREEGRLPEARETLRTAITRGGAELGMDHPRIADALVELARVELARGDRDAALRAASRAAEVTRGLPEGHASRLAAETALADCRAP